MLDQLQILARLYYQPARAFGAILDNGSLTFAALAAIAVGLGLKSLTLLAPLALLFVPGAVILAATWLGRGSAGVALQRDYAPMLACALFAWAATHVLILPVVYLAAPLLIWAQGAATVYFLLLAAVAVQTIAGATWLQGAGTALGSLAIAVGGYFAWGYLGGIPYYFASPLVLFWLYPTLRSNFDTFSGGLRSRQNFRRSLEASTLNPHDADAQYQLGLIYQERRNFAEAIARFQRAAQIDKSDPQPRFQLGCIAREQARFEEALQFLNATAELDPKHSSFEVWRELGATNLALGHADLARQQLEAYVEYREYDPQGLYWLGKAYKALNRVDDARSAFERAMEAARTSPPHLRRRTARWIGQSRSEMRSLPRG